MSRHPSPVRTANAMWLTNTSLLVVVICATSIYGSGVIFRTTLAVVAAVATEAACLAWRRQPTHLGDGSALLTGLIIGLCVPPLAPWYVPIFASFSGIALAKHCYGGLGNNPFNPAMAGYALAFAAFPAAFAGWLGESTWQSLFIADAAATPTPLQAVRLEYPTLPPAFSSVGAAAIVGGVYLHFRRISDWRLSASFLFGIAAVIFASNGNWHHLWHDSFLIAAFFVITDPVTAAATPVGRILYGTLVGGLAMWLRNNGAHADGIAFAVLIGNMLAAGCDYPIRRWQNTRSSS